jgi:hypothetical protein
MEIISRTSAALIFSVTFWPDANAFLPRMRVLSLKQQESAVQMQGWFDNLFPAPISDSSSAGSDRQLKYPEQYPATYDLSDMKVSSDDADAKLVRPLLKQTQLECRRLRVAYNARSQGWNPQAFHRAVDGQGAAIVLAKASRSSNENNKSKEWFGGYNPKGWTSLGGARPSVAAFLWYTTTAATITDANKSSATKTLQKLRKVGGGGLACVKDDGNTGIWLGADGLVIPLEDGNEPRRAQSKLGPYFERGPDNLSSIFGAGAAVELSELKVLVGVYERGEEIPYAGGVLDMTSG